MIRRFESTDKHAYLRRRGILPVTPTRKDQRANPCFDKAAYRQRNVI